MHSYGARKVAIFGVGPIGCTPFAITTHGTNGSLCVDTINLDAQLFNKKLVSLVDQLNKELTDAKFIYVDILGIGSGDPSLAGMISQTSSYFSSLSIYRLLIFEQIFLVIVYYVICAFQVSRLQMLGVVQLMKLGNVFVPKLHARIGVSTHSGILSILLKLLTKSLQLDHIRIF